MQIPGLITVNTSLSAHPEWPLKDLSVSTVYTGSDETDQPPKLGVDALVLLMPFIVSRQIYFWVCFQVAADKIYMQSDTTLAYC